MNSTSLRQLQIRLPSAFKALMLTLILPICSGCFASKLPPIELVPTVDLPRFMGDWYVIAAIPTFIEKDSFNAIENYKLAGDGRIETTFTFNKGSFSGPAKKYRPTGFVVENTNNALWGMQFIWPFKSEFRIVYLDPNYTQTIIARNARDYVWIMARTPEISEKNYQELVSEVEKMGYDTKSLRRVPHKKG